MIMISGKINDQYEIIKFHRQIAEILLGGGQRWKKFFQQSEKYPNQNSNLGAWFNTPMLCPLSYTGNSGLKN